jgi:spermidine/putrescine-binding protein
MRIRLLAFVLTAGAAVVLPAAAASASPDALYCINHDGTIAGKRVGPYEICVPIP